MISNQRGYSLVEMMIALALATVLGLSGYSLYEYSKKNTDRISDNIQVAITRLGASSILKRDLSAAELSFNYINILDDKNLPFFTHAKDQYCKHNACSRNITLKIKKGEKISRPIYFIIRKSLINEAQKLTVNPRSVFNGSNYAGINWQHNSDIHSISRKHFPLTSWEPKRLMVVRSENDFFDCNLSSKSNTSTMCRIECPTSGTCDFTIKRPYQFLGVVQDEPAIDMREVSVDNSAKLFLKDYNICRPSKTDKCASYIPVVINNTRNLYEKLPYIPGADDRTSIYNVEIVKYYLEESDNNNVNLMRALGSYEGGRVTFKHSIKIMTGLSSVIFSRVNISNPVIEYKFVTTNKRVSNL